MAAPSHHVTFRCALPPALAARAALGLRPRIVPRGVSVEVTEDGCALVTSADHLVSYATDQALATAARFLAEIGAEAPTQSLTGFLSTPVTRARARPPARDDPIRYAIALGAKVSITRVLIREQPVLVGAQGELRLVG